MASSSLPSSHGPELLPLSRPPSPLERPPSLCGLPLKYVSLVTLAFQNALLTIVMHHSQRFAPYSTALAVLLNELLKGSISCGIALYRLDKSMTDYRPGGLYPTTLSWLQTLPSRLRRLAKEIFSADCWKLSIPAILYVIQNNLQFVASSNLDIATFQVTYQMKILTTAAFSVVMLRKRLTMLQWGSLLGLAIGVGIVQIQAGAANKAESPSPIAHGQAHQMNPLKGFLAVSAACCTSGLAGVYFEMVLKNSQADLWVRNVQLSLFSLLPALAPVLFTNQPTSTTWFRDLFTNFGFWAWATVSIQVFGGLITAIVIKYSDNILKGFATSLSIIIAFLASVFLFSYPITPTFIVGAAIVLTATWLYNQPQLPKEVTPSSRGSSSSFPGSPVDSDDPILGQFAMKKRASLGASPRSMSGIIGISPSRTPEPTVTTFNGDAKEPIILNPPKTRPPAGLSFTEERLEHH